MNFGISRRILSFFNHQNVFFSNSRTFAHVQLRGIDVLRDPLTNKESSFSIRERQLLGIHGLLPPAVNTLEEQAIRAMINLRKMDDDLSKHLFLVSLQERNQTLFYKVLKENLEYCMPLIYTPTVGLACQKYGLMFRRPRGLYITIHDKMYIRRILDNWHHPKVRAIVVTDGERILGLGDLGAYGMGIPIGKLSLYTALAGIHPRTTLPILLDVGTDNQELLDDPLYLGVRHKRYRGKQYDEFLDAFMEAVQEKYGRHTLVQFEDFANLNAHKILHKYERTHCVFNDDIQGTAAVTLAGILGAAKISKRALTNNVFLFQGAGSAATGIASLLKMALVNDGLSESEALSKIFMFDINGLLTTCRPSNTFTKENAPFAQNVPYVKTLEEAVTNIKPTAIIGVAGVPNVFTPNLLKTMASNCDAPYIFALSNPTSKCECTAEDAYKYTNGKCIFACGSPFKPVEYENRVYIPSQCNNSYIFPGVALAIILFKIFPVPNEIFLYAAKSLASLVSDEEISLGRIFPPLKSNKKISISIAESIANYAYQHKIANVRPEPKNKEEFILKYWFSPQYETSLPKLYKHPE